MLHDIDSGPASTANAIIIRGAREHNLKNIHLDIPRGKFVVITGVSGSGKSTLAFDLLFSEGQRRFLDSMNAYARQFVEQLARPDVDTISGLPPTVSIEQRNSRGGGKSTVATVTEIYHFIRLVFARLGTQFCPDCEVPVAAQTADRILENLKEQARRSGNLILLAPLVKNRKGFHTDIATWALRHGYKELRADGNFHDLDLPFRLDRFREHDVEVVTGELSRRGAVLTAGNIPETPQQLVDATLKLGKGVLFSLDSKGMLHVHSTERSCPKCRRSFEPLDPKNFSYNSSQGWCPKCRGFGELFYLPDVERGANADSIEESWWGWQEGKREACPECRGARLKPEARAVRWVVSSGKRRASPAASAPTIDTFAQFSVDEAHQYVQQLKLSGRDAEIARDIVPEIRERLRFLSDVGLGYLQLGRGVTTLSGGENQRIRLAAQLGSNLSGVLYVLDEPTIGLHSRDNDQLLHALARLRERGNSLVVVEHDEETMRRADYVIDLGPGAGVTGGQVVALGSLAELELNPASVTGLCLRAPQPIPARGQRRLVPKRTPKRSKPSSKAAKDLGNTVDWLTVHHATTHNLKDLTVHFPLGRFVVVTGVSGSGKSTLIKECLLPWITEALSKTKRGGKSKPSPNLSGDEFIGAVHEVDQNPIGRTPRSTPATYVGFFDEIRALFAQGPAARMRGYGPGRFSFNSAQGRCPTCEGAGNIKLEMNFLPPAFVKCELCQGARFNPETLDIEYGGRNIAQVLDLSVAEAIQFFSAINKIRRPLEALHDTGLDYLKLGQTSPTLSGGEAQRVKLVSHLLTGLKAGARVADSLETRFLRGPSRGSLFVLEEPTIGLHMQDVQRLVEVIQRLVDAGHSVIVIEHNLDLIAEADWVIDLGPEAGAAGGEIVAEGTPEQLAKASKSHTGRFLKDHLQAKARRNG